MNPDELQLESLGADEAQAYVNLVQQAAEFARLKHGDQRYGAHTYYHHLDHVHRVARRFHPARPLPAHLACAALLHDTLEDTDTTFDELQTTFGETIARTVDYVTNRPGRNRKERHLATYPRLRESADAVFIKLCDRIANVEASRDGASSLLDMYRNEYAWFRQVLWRPAEFESAWQHLDALLAE